MNKRSNAVLWVTVVILFSAIITWALPVSAATTTGKVGGLSSTSHTTNTRDSKSQSLNMKMSWSEPAGLAESADYTATLTNYNYDFNTSSSASSYSVTENESLGASADSAEFTITTDQDEVAWYFHIRAAFTFDTAVSIIDGYTCDAGEVCWSTQETEGPYYIDNTAPKNAGIEINNNDTNTSSTSVVLTLGATGATEMKLATTAPGLNSAGWIDYTTSMGYTIGSTPGPQSVFVIFKDKPGNETLLPKSDSITLVSAAELSLNPSTTNITVGDTLTVSANSDQHGYTTGGYTYTAINESTGGMATVTKVDDSTATVTFSSSGTCKIQVADGDGSTNTAVTQTITVNKLTITPSSVSVAPSDQTTFTTENDKGVLTWSVDPGTCGTIVNGVFTAGAGTCSATITVADAGLSNYTATATVSVSNITMEIASGGAQTYTIGAIGDPLAISITGGAGGDEYSVTYQVTDQPTSSYTPATITGAAAGESYTVATSSGSASITLKLGYKVGPYVITATSTATTANTPVAVTNSPITFTIEGTAAEAANLTIVSGDDQTAAVGGQLDNELFVKVTDAYDNLVQGHSVTFASPDGYTISNADAHTNASGVTSTNVTFGPVPGDYTITAYAAPPIDYTATFTVTSVGEITNLTLTLDSSNNCVLTWNAAGGTFDIGYTNTASSTSADYSTISSGWNTTIVSGTYVYTDTTCTSATERYYQVEFTGTDLGKRDVGKLDISLLTGWNLVSMPFVQTETAVASAFTSITGKYSSVFGEFNSGSWSSFDPAGLPQFNSLTTIGPGKGYWIKMITDDTLNY